MVLGEMSLEACAAEREEIDPIQFLLEWKMTFFVGGRFFEAKNITWRWNWWKDAVGPLFSRTMLCCGSEIYENVWLGQFEILKVVGEGMFGEVSLVDYLGDTKFTIECLKKKVSLYVVI